MCQLSPWSVILPFCWRWYFSSELMCALSVMYVRWFRYSDLIENFILFIAWFLTLVSDAVSLTHDSSNPIRWLVSSDATSTVLPVVFLRYLSFLCR